MMELHVSFLTWSEQQVFYKYFFPESCKSANYNFSSSSNYSDTYVKYLKTHINSSTRAVQTTAAYVDWAPHCAGKLKNKQTLEASERDNPLRKRKL